MLFSYLLGQESLDGQELFHENQDEVLGLFHNSENQDGVHESFDFLLHGQESDLFRVPESQDGVHEPFDVQLSVILQESLDGFVQELFHDDPENQDGAVLVSFDNPLSILTSFQ